MYMLIILCDQFSNLYLKTLSQFKFMEILMIDCKYLKEKERSKNKLIIAEPYMKNGVSIPHKGALSLECENHPILSLEAHTH